MAKQKTQSKSLKLDVKAAGLALGTVWGAGVLIAGLLAMTGFGAEFVAAIGQYYIGYAATLIGSIIGGVWGFIDAFIGGVVIAWLYNKFSQ